MNNVIDKTKLGLTIRKARESIGMSQERLAESVGKAAKTITNYEKGKSLPTVTTLGAIAESLGYTFDDLVNDDLSRGSLHNVDKRVVDLFADTTPEEQAKILEFASAKIKALKDKSRDSSE